MVPLEVSDAELTACPELEQPASDKDEVIVPAYEHTVEAYNECAAGKDNLATKIREHNKKAKSPSATSLESHP